MRALVAALALTALTACVDVQQAVDETARAGARGVVTQVLATRFPQVPRSLVEPFTDCIIDNSSALEIREYVRAATIGVTDVTVTTVRSVLGRPETISCLGGAAGALG